MAKERAAAIRQLQPAPESGIEKVVNGILGRHEFHGLTQERTVTQREPGSLGAVLFGRVSERWHKGTAQEHTVRARDAAHAQVKIQAERENRIF